MVSWMQHQHAMMVGRILFKAGMVCMIVEEFKKSKSKNPRCVVQPVGNEIGWFETVRETWQRCRQPRWRQGRAEVKVHLRALCPQQLCNAQDT
jgi:hypothetical protein